ncbi:MAG TPA: hypothetical protein VKU02_21030 [Gemmataceae bacterium]|nr:hypothetical protein [Gemmataceae bacterium]
MKRKAMKRWVGACLLGSAVATGCSNDTGSRVEQRPPWVAHPYASPRNDHTVPTHLPTTPQTPALAQAPATLPAPDALPAPVPENKEPAKDAPILQTALDGSKTSPITEPSAVRRAFVDVTAQPCFEHTDDYGSLSGQLQHTHKGWRLRYASVDEMDTYGGSVTLTDETRLSGLKDGDLVRVHGRLLNPEDRAIAPAYQIMSIQVIEKHE